MSPASICRVCCMFILHLIRRCTSMGPQQRICQVWSRSEERFSRYTYNSRTVWLTEIPCFLIRWVLTYFQFFKAATRKFNFSFTETHMHPCTSKVCLTVTWRLCLRNRKSEIKSGQKFEIRVKVCLRHAGHCSNVGLTFCQMFSACFLCSPCR